MILRNSVNAGLGHSKTYVKGSDDDQKQLFERKRAFREQAKLQLEELGNVYSRELITSDRWCETIDSFRNRLSREFGPLLCEQKVRFGVAQKFVALYLKYRWLLGEKTKRPLFAVIDDGIMKTANVPNPPKWTKLDSTKKYLEIVQAIDRFAVAKGYEDGAAWEAEEWSDDE